MKIKGVELHGIRIAKKSNIKIRITMRMNRDLKSYFTAQNIFIKSKININFNKK